MYAKYITPNCTAPIAARHTLSRNVTLRNRRNGRKTSRASPSRAAETNVLSTPPRKRLISPNENAQINETMISWSIRRDGVVTGVSACQVEKRRAACTHRIPLQRKRLATASYPENCTEPLAENEAQAGNRDAEENHRPDAEGAGDEFSVTEQLEEFHDRFRDGVERLFLGEDERVAHLQHRKGKGQQPARDHVRDNQRQCYLDHGSERRGTEILRGLFQGFAGLLEAGGSGAHDVRQPANRVGDNQQNRGVAGWVQERE